MNRNSVPHPLLHVFNTSSIENNESDDTTNNKNISTNKTQMSITLQRKMHALKWRQVHQNKDICEFEINNKTISIKQIINPEENGIGTGGQVWPAAIVLCKYLEKRYSNTDNNSNTHSNSSTSTNSSSKDTLKYKRVFELGSGTGVVGLVASLLGASSVIITDVESVFPLMHENCKEVLVSHISLFGYGI